MGLRKEFYQVDQTMRLKFKPRSVSVSEALGLPRLIRKNFEVPLPMQDNELILLGRDDSAVSIAIHDEFVSRVHAAIIHENGCFYLRDLRSKNGTFLNGTRLPSDINSRALMDGDKVGFNHVEFHFYSGQFQQAMEGSFN